MRHAAMLYDVEAMDLGKALDNWTLIHRDYIQQPACLLP